MYTEGHTVKGAQKLPLNLLDALRALGASGLFQEAFGNEFVAAYIKLKTQAWNEYSRHLTRWELQTTLDC
jgi:glutamine synthetase